MNLLPLLFAVAALALCWLCRHFAPKGGHTELWIASLSVASFTSSVFGLDGLGAVCLMIGIGILIHAASKSHGRIPV